MIKNCFLIIFIISNLYSSNLLTQNDKQYLEKLAHISICSTEHNMPFEDFDKNNNHIGMASSYFKIFKKELNVNIRIVKTSSIKQSLAFLENDKCDAISIYNNKIKNKKLLYTTPYIITPIVLAIKSPVPFITDFYNLKDKKLVIGENVSYKELLLDNYSNINNLHDISSVRDGLKKVNSGEVFGAIGTLAEIGYYFYQDYMGELKIAGKTDLIDLELSMVFKSQDNKLYSIFNKLILNLDKSIHYDIVSKWTSISYGTGIPSQIIFKIGIFIAIIFIIIIFFIVILKRKIKKAVEINREKDKYIFLQSRLAQMGEMLSMISHQWRQPLSIISTIVIKMQLSNENKVFNKYLDDINNYVQYLSNTLNDFRNFYKPNKKIINIDITSPINDALNIITPSLKKDNINLKTNFISNQNIDTYSSELTQVILVIIQNSIDNFKNSNQLEKNIKITTKNNDQNIVRIEIEDNGGGIDETIISKIFDPYFSTKNEKNGTGLGLYMSKLIIEDYHNGRLDVKNTKGGVSFNIDIYSLQK